VTECILLISGHITAREVMDLKLLWDSERCDVIFDVSVLNEVHSASGSGRSVLIGKTADDKRTNAPLL
jgi:hypothetical protein